MFRKRMINFMAGLLFFGIFCLSSGAFGSLPYDHAALSSEVVFIDPSVPEMERIVAQLPQGAEVVRLSPGMDGVAQISEHLAGKMELSAIRIISHGDAGHFVLNGKRIDRGFLRDHDNIITSWGRSLAENGDILLYACNLAATDEGKAFVERFVDLTGADVAASTDVTGGEAFNGNWNLEYSIGQIDCIATTVDPNIDIKLAGTTRIWTAGYASSDWGNPANWDTGVPQNDDIIVIPLAEYDPVFTGSGSYASLTISDQDATLTVSSGTLSVTGTSDINGTLSISTGTFDANGVFDATDGNVTFTGAGNLELASTVTSLGTFTKSTGTVTYDGGDQDVAAVDYYGITFGGTGTKTAASSLTATTLSAPASAYSVALNGGCTITNSCTFLNTGTTTIGNESTDSSTFTGGVNATAGPVSIAGTVATTNSAIVLGTTTVSDDATINPAGGAVTLGAVTISNAKTLIVGTGNTGAISFGSTIDSAGGIGNLTINTIDTATATFSNSVGGTTAIGALTLTAGNVSAGTSNVKAGTITVNGGTFGLAASPTGTWDVDNVTIASGATMNATTGTFTVSGNWTNSGTFNHKNGTVTLDGSNQTLSGSTTFYSLTKNVTPAATLTFPSGTTTTVENTLDLSGASGELLSLRSSTSGTQWALELSADPWAPPTIAYLDVQDSNNISNTAINAVGTNSISSGNNTNWTFYNVTPNTYYVNIQSGDNSLDGLSSVHAWKTLHYAIDQINGGSAGSAGSGYTLNVLLGAIYNTDNGEANRELTISQDYVTIAGETGSGPIIDGTDATSWAYGIKISGSHVTLRNLYITGFTGTDPEGTGIEIITGSNNTVENCRIYGNHDGISVWQSANCTIQGCEIDNNDFDGISINESADSIITQNTIHDNFETDNSDGIIVQNCNPEISRNTIYDNRFNISLQADSGDITSPTIKNNLIYESTLDEVHYGIYVGGNSGSTVNPQIYHNTIDGSLYQGILIEGTGDTPIIKYNIVTNCRQSGIQNSGNPTIDYNDVWHNGPDPYDRNYDGCTAGAHDISLDPQYASYTLAVTSPCINAIPTGTPPNDPVAVDLNGDTRPYGSGFDMGCYENNNLPAVTTTAVSSVTANSASSGGTDISAGGESSVTAKGVCWSTSANPTVALSTKTTDGTGTGTFTSSITGLSANTTYHVRAYATNSDNVTGYGSDKTFTTSSATAPTVTTTAASSITTTTASSGGNVTSDGGASVTARGVCWSTSADPTVALATKTTDGTGTGTFTSSITGLSANTTYHVRAYATNSDNVTGYGSDKTFTTGAPAGTYYVNIVSGDDANDGSSGSPWKTLHHAISQMNAGGTGTYVLRVALGTYSVSNGEQDAQLVLSQSSVTIKGESGSGPIIDGTNAQTWTKGLEVTGSDVTMVNLYVTGFSDTNEEGIRISGGTGNEIRYCKTYGNNWGIRVNEATNTTIKNCDIYGNTTHGIDIVQSSGTTVVYNRIHGNPQYGIRTESSPEISRNLIYDNTFGILVEALNENSASPTIKNNVIYETVSGAMSYGIFTRASNYSQTNPKIYHNTIDGGTLSGISMEKDDSSSSAPFIKYNIITEFGQYGINNSGAGPTIDYNDVWNNTAGNYNGCTTGANDISLDPKYGSYSLQSDSPCISTILSGAGDPVILDYPGYKRPRPGKTTKDMGAYEYVADEINNYTLPGGTGLATDYRIFTVPLNLGTGTDMLTAMENVLGTYDPVHWRAFLYTGTLYREFNSSQFASATITPGMGFWIITTYTDNIPFEAKPAPDGVDYVMELQSGWHLIGLPWVDTGILLSSIKVTDGVNTYAISSPSNDLTQRFMWDFTGDGPDNGYVKRSAVGFRLQNNTGYFFKVTAATSIRLIIPTSDAASNTAPTEIPLPPNQTNTNEDDELPPPPPGAAPSPDIKVNGQDGPVAVSAGDSVSVSITLDPGTWSGRNADWWIAARTPFDPPLNWYTYVYPVWLPGIQVCVQIPLLEITEPFSVLDAALPVGNYTFYFAVDGNMDGAPDVTWMDSVEVNVE